MPTHTTRPSVRRERQHFPSKTASLESAEEGHENGKFAAVVRDPRSSAVSDLLNEAQDRSRQVLFVFEFISVLLDVGVFTHECRDGHLNAVVEISNAQVPGYPRRKRRQKIPS